MAGLVVDSERSGAWMNGRPTKRAVQIRVHGVAGTEPRVILRTDPEKVDRPGATSGVTVLAAPPKPPEGFAELRAFNWTDLTSGRLGQGWRALLAPLLFVNVAGWMLPRFDDDRRGHQRRPSTPGTPPRNGGVRLALAQASVRMAGLATTGALMIGLTWALYLAPATACNAMATTVPRDDTVKDLTCTASLVPAEWPEWRWAALLAIVLSLLLGVLPWRRRQVRGKSVRDASATEHRSDETRKRRAGADVIDAGLDWVGRVSSVERSPQLTYLGAVHGLFALCIVAASWAVSDGFWSARAKAEVIPYQAVDASGANAAIWVTVVVLFVLAMLAAALDPGDGRQSSGPPLRDRVAALVLLGVPSALCVALLAPRFGSHDDLVEAALLNHFSLVNVVVVGFGVVPLIIVAIVAIGLSDNRAAGARAAGVLGLSMLIGGAMSAGLAFVVVWALGLIKLRHAYGGNEHVAFALLITLGLFVGWCLLDMIRKPPGPGQDPRSGVAQLVGSRLGVVTWALVVSQIVGWTIGIFSTGMVKTQSGVVQLDPLVSWWLVIAAIVFPIGCLIWLGVRTPVRPRRSAIAAVIACVAVLVLGVVLVPTNDDVLKLQVETMGLIVPLIVFVGLVLRWVSSFESRRGLGAVSDLATFWPRSFHPYVPRPYSSTAIAELADEIETTRGLGHPVLLAGHSQGSLLAALAVLQTTPPMTHPPMALLTYGSPIGHLYAQAFPAVFELQQLARLAEARTDAWVNLYRATDPIAHPIPGAENRLVEDPGDGSLRDGDDPHVNRAYGHSRYETTGQFTRATETVRQALEPS